MPRTRQAKLATQAKLAARTHTKVATHTKAAAQTKVAAHTKVATRPKAAPRPKLATVDVALVEDTARHVPGYRGYLEPSQRREDDRRFRLSIAEQLKGEAHRLERIESKQFRDDLSDLLEQLDGDARKLEFLAESVILVEHGRPAYADDVVERVGRLDRDIVEHIERLHRLVHELEKAYEHDEQFEMNLAELRELTESIADLIEQRNVVLTP